MFIDIPIKINVLNLKTGNLINKKFVITNNDTTQNIKEKIFMNIETEGNEDPWLPEYINIYDENKRVLNNKTINIFKDNIYASNIIDDIRGHKLVKEDDYEKYKEKYDNLTINNFKKLIKYLRYEEIESDENDEFIDLISSTYNRLKKKWDEIDKLDKLYSVNKIGKFDNMIISRIEVLINNEENALIDLFKIFNNLELTERYVGIILNGNYVSEYKKEPLVKINKKLTIGITKRGIKEWIFNNSMVLKRNKNIILKVVYKNVLYDIDINTKGIMNIIFDKNIYKINEYIEINYDEIIENMNVIYKDLINEINIHMSEVYNTNVSLSKKYIMEVTSLTAEIDYKKRIMKNALVEFCSRNVVRDNLFSAKNNKGELSLLYTRNKRIDTKGITINIHDHPYVMNESKIKILDCKNIDQYFLIIKYLCIIDEHNRKDKNAEKDADQVLKQKSAATDLKKKGVKISSTSCQSKRQPIVDEVKKSVKGSYVMKWNENRYVCPGISKTHIYPGFTAPKNGGDDVVCCFIKDQRNSKKYIKNMKSEELEIIVQASNYNIKIGEKETLLIKLISGPNKMKNTYYYLDYTQDTTHLNLIPITNAKILKKIQEIEFSNKNIWLESVPLTTLTTTAHKNKCNKSPILNNSKLDLCSQHKTHKYFGYNINSYPCCFETQKDIYSSKLKTDKIDKQHILQSNKVLDINQIGIIWFRDIFKKIDQESDYYRLGNLQNENSFLNAIMISIDKKYDTYKFENMLDFKNYLAEQFIKNKLFHKINDGNLQDYWKDENEFIKDFKNKNIDYKILIDLIFNILQINIYIIDINEDENDLSKIICQKNYNEKNPNILLIKRNKEYIHNIDIFEIIIKMNEDDRVIKKIFSKEDLIVKVFNKFIKASCKITYKYPKDYQYKEFIKITDFEEKEIEMQYINNFSKVNWISLKRYPDLILPIEEVALKDNIKSKHFNKIKDFSSLAHSRNYINKINKRYDLDIKENGIIKTSDEKMDGLLLNYGLILPIDKVSDNLEFLEINYYPKLEQKFIISKGVFYDNYYEVIYIIEKYIAKKITSKNKDKEKLIETILSKKLNNSSKYKIIYNIISKYKHMDKLDYYVKIITNNILQDARMSIINNNVSKHRLYNEIKKKDNEIILSNLQEFYNFIKN